MQHAPCAPRLTRRSAWVHATAQPPGRPPAAPTPPTPLLDAVLERGGRARDVPLHVPGHKRGAALHAKLRRLLGGQDAARHDLTELSGLDYLSSPGGPILGAQQAAAAAFGADHTWFLVNGCTAGIHAAIMATCGPGTSLILARNCHLSALAAMVLTGCHPIWMQPEVDARHGLANCPTADTLAAAFTTAEASGARVGAVMIVSPTYFGAAAHVTELAAACHARGVPLIVDEAHGAHFRFLPPQQQQQAWLEEQRQQPQQGHQQQQRQQQQEKQQQQLQQGQPHQWRQQQGQQLCPASALQCGADAVIHSTHKVLTALTQAAMLHVVGGRVDPERVTRALQLLQSSSPSYLLMASLDAATAYATQAGVWDEPLAAAQAARAGLRGVPGLSLVGEEAPGGASTSDRSTTNSSETSAVSADTAAAATGTTSSSAATSSSQPWGTCPISVSGWDPLRVGVDVLALSMSGYDAAAWLEERHGIVSELATPQVVLFVFGPGSSREHADRLVAACRDLAATAPLAAAAGASAGMHSNSGGGTSAEMPVPVQALPPRAAFFAASEAVPAQAAVGRVCAELLCPYPPGVPVLCPGEVVTAAALAALQRALAQGGVVTGAADATLATMRVVAASEVAAAM